LKGPTTAGTETETVAKRRKYSSGAWRFQKASLKSKSQRPLAFNSASAMGSTCARLTFTAFTTGLAF
jgi:hypothetical protein